MTRKQHTARRREQHAAALATLHADPVTVDGADMFRRLRRLECSTHRAATDYCNGKTTAEQWEQTKEHTRARIAAIFGGRLPEGFFVNGDPRGYALKLKTAPYGLETDWGQNGILAPKFNA